METVPGEAELSAVIVQRVSKKGADRERSVDDQETENRAECSARGWRIAAAYSQQQSASRFARTSGRRKTWAQAWKELTAEVAGGAYGVVVMWESSRGDRRLAGWAGFLDACRETGTLIHVTSHNRTYDIQKNWRDGDSLAREGVDNAAEAEKTSERTRRGIRRNVTEGLPHGKIPYGYERLYDPRTKQFIRQQAHPEQAAIVREIKERTAAGVPVKAIVRDLNERGVPTRTGVPWTHQTVRQIALSPAYIGQRLWRGTHGDGRAHDAKWEPLVSEEVHYAAVAVLTTTARDRRRPGRDLYMLSFLAACASCGRNLEGKKDSKSLPAYRCPGGCCMTRAPWLDAYVSQLVIRKLSDPASYAQITAESGEQQKAAREDVARLKGRLEEVRASYVAGRIPIETLEAINADLRPQLERAEKRAAELAVAGPVRPLLMTPREDITARWEAMEVPQRKAVVRAMFSEITLKPGKPGAPRGSRARFDPDRVRWDWVPELR